MYYQQPDGVSVHDGFPNPAADGSLQPLSLNQLLIKNPVSTYFVRAEQDILIIDRSLTPHPTDTVIWTHHDRMSSSVHTQVPKGAELWGVVTARITQYRWKNS